MASPEKDIATEVADLSTFISKANALSIEFLAEVLKDKKERIEARENELRKNLEEFILQAKHEQLSSSFDKFNACTLLFLGRSAFKANKDLCLKYILAAIQKQDMSPPLANYIKNNVGALLIRLKTVPDLFARCSRTEVDLIDKVVAETGAVVTTKTKDDSSALLREFCEVGFKDKVKYKMTSPSALKNIEKAVASLASVPAFDSLTARDLWEITQKLHKVILPDYQYIPNKNGYIFVIGANFFTEEHDYSYEVLQNLNDSDKAILLSIQRKMNLFLHGVKVIAKGTMQGVKETLMIEGYMHGHYQGQKLDFTPTEKALIQRFYDIKPRHPIHVVNKRMIEGLDRVLKLHKTDVIKAAAHVFMFIVHEHPWDDGNGRVARLMCEEMLKRKGFPKPLYPHRSEYDAVVKTAIDKNDYDIFEKFMRSNMQGLLPSAPSDGLKGAGQDFPTYLYNMQTQKEKGADAKAPEASVSRDLSAVPKKLEA